MGYTLSIGAATLWGVSGTFAQFLFEHRSIDPEWLVTIRLLISGLTLLLLSRPGAIWKIWAHKRDAASLIAFALFGMLAVQYTYFAAIKNSNAATATVLQYLGPAFIAIYFTTVEKRLPKIFEFVAIFLALGGTYLLVTHGRSDTLVISKSGFFWGIASAIALASYSIQPLNLLKKYEASSVIGWGMLLGGLALSLVHAPWNVEGDWDAKTFAFTSFIVVFGTLLPFYAYLTAVKMIGPTKASVLACAEPLSATTMAVFWLGVSFGVADWLGTFLVLSAIGVLTLRRGTLDAA